LLSKIIRPYQRVEAAGFNIENREELMNKHGHININLEERYNLVRGPAAAQQQ